MKVLELFSGIGGMHMALKESGLQGQVKVAIEINDTANAIYKHNFPEVERKSNSNRNILGLTADIIKGFQVDTILMSPPCQPFTRNGLKRGAKDDRCDPFKHLLNMLPSLPFIERILIENVKGFENSDMRDILIQTLTKCGYFYQEFMLSPSQFGVPNSRYRYYCLARKSEFSFQTGPLMDHLPTATETTTADVQCFEIGAILERDGIDFSSYFLKEKALKYAMLLDICHETSRNSCCFTKAYSKFVEGTGSVFTHSSPDRTRAIYKESERLTAGSKEHADLLSQLGLRFFTPKEVCRLMSFPETFEIPDGVTDRQKYMVLGNSINVKVVAELIKLLA